MEVAEIMSEWLQLVLVIFGSVAASSGFWAFMMARVDKKDVTREMLVGLAHDRIMWLGMCYIEQGWITCDEYENLYTYLYKPYKKLDGNGSAKRVMEEVNKLKVVKNAPFTFMKGETDEDKTNCASDSR